jgi:hypothetical protein
MQTIQASSEPTASAAIASVVASADSRSESAASSLLGLTAVAYLVVAAFPSTYYHFQPGLDPSWMWAINWLADSQFRFGRDVTFTYGPLGYLLYPANVGDHVLWSTVFRWAVTGLTTLALFSLVRRRSVRFALFTAVTAIALGLGQVYEFHLLIVVGLGALVAVERRAGLVLLAAALGAAPLALIKFSLGIGVLALLLTAAALLALRGERRSAAAAIGAHLLAVAGLAVLFTGSPSSALRWLRGSWEITSGYSAGMSLGVGWTDQWLGILMLGVYGSTAIALWRSRSEAAWGLSLLAGPLFVVFKAGFVREDAEHVVGFYSFAVAAAAVALLGASDRRQRALVLRSIVVIVGLAVFGLASSNCLDIRKFMRAASGLQGAHGVAASYQTRAIKLDLDRATNASLLPDVLPQDLRAAIGAASVLVWPWEYAYCPANRLSCVPQPALQAYAAYTPWLDRASANQLEGPGAPERILIHSAASIDGRNAIVDASFWWRALLRWYEPVALPTREPLLLRRREIPRQLSQHDLGIAPMRVGEWQSLPAASGLLFAELRWTPNLRGILTRPLLRISPISLEIRLASGEVHSLRIIPDTAADGMMLAPLAEGLADIRSILGGGSGPRAVAVRLIGDGARFYRRDGEFRFFELR